MRFESLPASLELLRPPSASAAFRATSSLIPARTVNRSVTRGIPVPRYSACTPTPKSRAGFRTRRTPCFPSCVKVLFQTGNAHGVPRVPRPFAPSAPKSFLCAVSLAVLPPESGSPAGLRCHDLGVVQLLKEQQTFIPFASSGNAYTPTPQTPQHTTHSQPRNSLCCQTLGSCLRLNTYPCTHRFSTRFAPRSWGKAAGLQFWAAPTNRCRLRRQ